MIPELSTYLKSITTGKQPTCQFVIQAVERHKRDLKDGKKRGLVFDETAAKIALAFFGILHHSKGEWAGQTFVPAGWETFVIASVFGWKRADGTRRFRRAYIEVPRKNGKSTLLAGIGLYLLAADGEPGAEIYSAATKRDQARIVHGEAVRMVKSSPMLQDEISVYRDNLNVLASHSKYEPLGADSDTLDGLNVHAALIDELHAHKTRGVVDILDTATSARRQPLIVEITTAGWDKQSVCWEHHDYSRQVLEGSLPDDAWFAFIAGADKDDDWQDETTWRKANPNLGISVKLDDLKRKAERAARIPAEQNTFKRLHLNMWTEQNERWLDMAEWNECETAIDWAEFNGRECFAGLDLASTTDIAALVLLFPDYEGEQISFTALPFFWIPEDGAEDRTRSGNVPYTTWVNLGMVEATSGNVIDYKAIMERLKELAGMYQIKEVAYDRWGATQLIRDMQDEGFEVIPFGQGFASMTAPTKELMNCVLTRRIQHDGNPVLRWMASNVVVAQDPAGNLKPDKSKSGEKIDGMVALIMALDRATRKADSVYEERGIEVW